MKWLEATLGKPEATPERRVAATDRPPAEPEMPFQPTPMPLLFGITHPGLTNEAPDQLMRG
jgi:hypothetical protein